MVQVRISPPSPTYSISHLADGYGHIPGIFSCSSDKSIMGVDLETKKIIFEQKKAHKYDHEFETFPELVDSPHNLHIENLI